MEKCSPEALLGSDRYLSVETGDIQVRYRPVEDRDLGRAVLPSTVDDALTAATENKFMFANVHLQPTMTRLLITTWFTLAVYCRHQSTIHKFSTCTNGR